MGVFLVPSVNTVCANGVSDALRMSLALLRAAEGWRKSESRGGEEEEWEESQKYRDGGVAGRLEVVTHSTEDVSAK